MKILSEGKIMKQLRIAMLVAMTAVALAACGSTGSGQATIAAPASAVPTQSSATPSTVVTATSETPAQTTVIVTDPPTVTVTAPPPVISTVTQTEQPPVIIVPDPTTVYTDYDGPFDLPAGLLCRNLKDMGYSYSDAIVYWNYYGQPDEMDIDLNGIPCETVY